MKNFSETFKLTSDLDTKNYELMVQSKLDELTDLLANANKYIPGADNVNFPIWEYVAEENYTALFAVVSLLTNGCSLDNSPERVKKINELIVEQ